MKTTKESDGTRWIREMEQKGGQSVVMDCPTCLEIATKHNGFGPTHDGSRYCESGSIASGGTNAHCTCDVCF